MNKIYRKDKKENTGINIIESVSAVTLFTIFMIYFNRIVFEGGDYIFHINYARILFSDAKDSCGLIFPFQAKTYPLFHFLTWLIALVTRQNFELAAAIVLSVSSIASVFVAKHIIYKLTKNKNGLSKWSYIISISFVFFETFAGPLTEWRIYARQCAPNPWHNPTIIVCRPFGLLAFLYYIETMNDIRGNKSYYKHLGLFSLYCFFSTLAKPSFLMVLLPGIGVHFLVFIIKDIINNWKLIVSFSIFIFPVVAVILGQLLFVFLNQESIGNGLGIAWGGFSGFTTIEVICVSIATFPVVLATIVLYWKYIGKYEYLLISILILLFGWMEMFFLTDGGSGNYSWGYDLAVGISTLCSLIAIRDTDERKWKRHIVYFLFLGQVVTGIYYFVENYRRYNECWF